MALSDIQFFGKVDRDRDGKITSNIPAWYFDTHIDSMREEIERKERAITRNEIPYEDLERTKAEIRKSRVRLNEITQSKPTITDKDRDKVGEWYKDLEEKIKDALPTRSDDLMGRANPQEEFKKNKKPCIPVDASLIKALGMRQSEGKITRDQAVTAYKIIGKALGENTDIERIRREGNYGTYHSTNDITKAILEGMRQQQG